MMEIVFKLDVLTKHFNNDKQVRVFLSFIVYFRKRVFPSKAFSMSELNLYQFLKLNYYKLLQEWWTDDVDGHYISVLIFIEFVKFV